jgi:hypothetical protein
MERFGCLKYKKPARKLSLERNGANISANGSEEA